MKLYVFTPRDASPPLISFLNSLEDKLKRKLIMQLEMLETASLLKEPHVKHFTIEKYKHFYELRVRNKVMVRVIFTRLENGDILLLAPFVKKQARNTMQALDVSLRMLSQIKEDAGLMKELPLRGMKGE